MKGGIRPSSGVVWVCAVVLAVAMFGFMLLYRPLPEPQFNEIVNDPPESELDWPKTTSARLLTAESNLEAMTDSIAEVHFSTGGQDICLFGNFTSTGNGDTRIDFMILTNQGYWDFLDDGIVEPDSIFMVQNDTNGFYWEKVLPHIYNGDSVTTWYTIYSAFNEPWWQPWSVLEPWRIYEKQYRDVSAKVCQDLTPPKYDFDIPDDQPAGRLLMYIQVFDDRCGIANATVLVNGTQVAYFSSSRVIEEPVEWSYQGLMPGNHTINLALYVEDEVGNHQLILLVSRTVTIPDPMVDLANGLVIGSIVLFIVILGMILLEGPTFIILVLTIITGGAGSGALALGNPLGMIGLAGSVFGFVYLAYRFKHPRH